MSSGEKINPSSGETSAEEPRGVYEDRGEKTIRAERQEREKRLLDEIAELEAEKRALLESIEEGRKRLGTSTASTETTPTETAPTETTSGETTQTDGINAPETAPTETSNEPAIAAAPVETTSEAEPKAPAERSKAPEAAVPTNGTPVGEKNPEDEPITKETRERLVEKSKKKKGLRALVASIVMVALLVTGGSGILGSRSNDAANENIDDQSAYTLVEEAPADKTELEIAEHGIKDGYGEKGMWLSEHKTSDYAFTDAGEVAEVCKNDECEMIKYAAGNQVETFADYLANLPEQLQPEEFRGLSILETEAKLESLSDEEFDAVKDNFDKTIDAAFTRSVVVNGRCQNSYMSLKDSSGAVDHENMKLVQCTTNENNLEATQLFWLDEDGSEIGQTTFKMSPVYDEDGNIISFKLCMQVINPEGSKPDLYEGMSTVEEEETEKTEETEETEDEEESIEEEDDDETPPTPPVVPPSKPETPPENPEAPQPKNQEEANENSGASAGIVTPERQEREITEEPVADPDHGYNTETNTYNYTPAEQAAQIGYGVENDIRDIGQESASITAPEDIVSAEEMVANQTAPEMVTGTREGVDEANDFDAGATIGTGEVTGDTQSADGSGNTIQENLDAATGNQEANPTGDYSQGF